MSSLTDAEVEAIRARAEAATEVPWPTYNPHADVAALLADRERLVERCGALKAGFNLAKDAAEAAEAALSAERARSARLVEALAPLAAIPIRDDLPNFLVLHTTDDTGLEAGHVRRARAALKEAGHDE